MGLSTQNVPPPPNSPSWPPAHTKRVSSCFFFNVSIFFRSHHVAPKVVILAASCQDADLFYPNPYSCSCFGEEDSVLTDTTLMRTFLRFTGGGLASNDVGVCERGTTGKAAIPGTATETLGNCLKPWIAHLSSVQVEILEFVCLKFLKSSQICY